MWIKYSQHIDRFDTVTRKMHRLGTSQHRCSLRQRCSPRLVMGMWLRSRSMDVYLGWFIALLVSTFCDCILFANVSRRRRRCPIE
ncbi:unnamed protein product [Anisakis simplex]|uniref:Uncharacterized protein n=1 Tax=Anisakis simplex TaxID=6269 RepID=A0A0M3JPV7_ANISI|nr:unnamed protein product [Anisakis simplex]